MAYLEGAGFRPAAKTRKKRQCWLGYGKTKTGKTRFGLTMPGPIAIINFDRDLEDVLASMPHVDVEVASFATPARSFSEDDGERLQKLASALEKDIARSIEAAFASKHIRTVMVDKETTLWEIVRLAEFGRVAGVRARNYEFANLRMRSYVQRYQETDKNAYFVGDVKDEWQNDKPTGRIVHDGFKQSGGSAQMVVEFSRAERLFKLKFIECALQPGFVGAEFEAESISFPALASLVQPETTEEDWR